MGQPAGCNGRCDFVFSGYQMEPAYQQASAWAQGELARGTDPEALVSGLMSQGWAELQARQVLDAALTSGPALAPVRAAPVMAYASPVQRPSRSNTSSGGSSRHTSNMVLGLVICGIGLAITFGTYATATSSGGTYTVCWGAMLFGFIRFIRGFAGWMSGG
jgi:hypothetical protein